MNKRSAMIVSIGLIVALAAGAYALTSGLTGPTVASAARTHQRKPIVKTKRKTIHVHKTAPSNMSPAGSSAGSTSGSSFSSGSFGSDSEGEPDDSFEPDDLFEGLDTGSHVEDPSGGGVAGGGFDD